MRRPIAALALSALALVTPSLASAPARAQQEPEKVLESTTSGLNLASVQAKVAQGDAAAAGGKLSQAKTDYDQARLGAQNLDQRARLNLGFSKTTELPTGFLLGVALVIGVISGGASTALLLPRADQGRNV